MAHEKKAIVTTTIYVPKLLGSHAEDALKHGHDLMFIVVADKKTPLEAESFCKELADRTAVRIEYFSVKRQEEYLSRFPALKEHIQWNCIQRRNVGTLYAYEEGCEVIVTIDDDNFRIDDNYLGAHGVGEETEVDVVSSSTSWINICRMLKELKGREFYHRGFPLEKKHAHETWTAARKKIRPVVNAGLWLGDPDIDAMTRLHYMADPIEATEFIYRNRYLVPAKGTWTTFNSQNTALAREVIPAYFLSPKAGRYDDIWAGYIIKKIADHKNDSIRFGKPIVKQERNPHNYWRDLDAERQGHALTLRFVEALASINLAGTDYHACYGEVVEQLPAILFARTDIRDDERAFLDGYFTGMRIWHDVFKTL